MIENVRKHKDAILFTIGTLLIIISFYLLAYDRVERLKSNVFDNITMEKDHEKEGKVSEILQNFNTVVSVENVEVDADNELEQETYNQQVNYIKREYIGYLEIDKISLKNGLVSKNSRYNNVNYNIQILNDSDYPDDVNGNVILAAHSGTSYISFFKNLYKLTIGDAAKIYYKDIVYTYKITSIYNVPKVGYAAIRRNTEKSCLTLITCTHGSDTEQTIYILELVSSAKEGD